MERTERTIVDNMYDMNDLFVKWSCPECHTVMYWNDYLSPTTDTIPCACGYQWQVEVRPRFYITRE